MKPVRPPSLMVTAMLLLSFSCCCKTAAQGRVVINEYMPWTPAACGASAEFVELLNFGPGPVNIGCYILTDGDYSITIPANTIIQPGEFYVLSGMDIIAYPCGNIDSTIHSDLNWTTCNCSSSPIPTTGDGFMTDGGSANEQLVLLDPDLNIIDVVARSLPVEPSSLIVTSSAGGNCTPRVFDLDLMSINYETIGESAGRGNSFARRLDGDCGWVKDPQQSGNATNNTPGDVSDISYNFQYLNPVACPNTGSIAVVVNASDYSNVFPMSYTLAYDTDDDGIFEITDTYTTGTATNPNTITVSSLVPGTYRLTVASVKGCYLKTFPFIILDCQDVLQVQLTAFAVERKSSDQVSCSWSVENGAELADITIERSEDGISFLYADKVAAPVTGNNMWSYTHTFRETQTTKPFFRLLLKGRDGRASYSSVLQLPGGGTLSGKLWPNPVTDRLYITAEFPATEMMEALIVNTGSSCVMRKNTLVRRGNNQLSFSVKDLPPGYYRLIIRSEKSAIRLSYGFLKQ